MIPGLGKIFGSFYPHNDPDVEENSSETLHNVASGRKETLIQAGEVMDEAGKELIVLRSLHKVIVRRLALTVAENDKLDQEVQELKNENQDIIYKIEELENRYDRFDILDFKE